MLHRKTLALLICLTLTPMASFADTRIQARTIGVLDGDTIDVLDAGNQRIRIRLANIDAPEKSQAYGQKSKRNLAEMVAGKNVEVILLEGSSYQRRIGRVFIDGVEANVEQVRDGFAWVYTQYNHDKQLPALQESARRNGKGLWADAHPVEPWNYRHSK